MAFYYSSNRFFLRLNILTIGAHGGKAAHVMMGRKQNERKRAGSKYILKKRKPSPPPVRHFLPAASPLKVFTPTQMAALSREEFKFLLFSKAKNLGCLASSSYSLFGIYNNRIINSWLNDWLHTG